MNSPDDSPDVNKVLRRLRYAQYKLGNVRRMCAHYPQFSDLRLSWCHDHERAVLKLLDELWGAQQRAAL